MILFVWIKNGQFSTSHERYIELCFFLPIFLTYLVLRMNIMVFQEKSQLSTDLEFNFCITCSIAICYIFHDILLLAEPPPVIARPFDVSVLPGSDAVMSCFISSTVEYNITWDKPNTLVSLQGHNRVSYLPICSF